jgi:nitrogen fixation protein NifU and related proteins
MNFESMYQDIILDHYRNPHHRGLREPYDAEVHHVNPLCGDELTVRVSLKDTGGEQTVTDLVIGKSIDDAMVVFDEFLALMRSKGAGQPDEDLLEDAVAFSGVSKYPARIKCALLGWMAWKDATARALEEASS